MEIIGYSERGAMNALFYGITLNNDIESMKKFLKMAKIEEEYNDFTVYSEFSLSDFGDPDMVIIADKKNGETDVIFIEAKVSCGKNFDLSKQHDDHNKYIQNGVYESGQSSNLFFQLRQKNYFFKKNSDVKDLNVFPIPPLIENYDRDKTKPRRIGNNKIVLEFADHIKKCNSAHYVAIIPKSDFLNDYKTEYGFDIHFVDWESLVLVEDFKKYLSNTIVFNQQGNYNQILNK